MSQLNELEAASPDADLVTGQVNVAQPVHTPPPGTTRRMKDKDTRRLLQTVAATLLLIVLSSAPYIELPRIFNQPLDSHAWSYVYPYWGVGLACLVGVARRLKTVAAFNQFRDRLVPLGAFAALLILAPLWSERLYGLPEDALLVALILCTGVWFGLALDAGQWASSLFISSQGLVFASFLEGKFRPRFGISVYGEWVGVFGNRNSLAPVCGLGIVAAVGLWMVFRKRWMVPLGVAASILDLYVLRRSGSATTWVSLLVAFGVVVIARLVWALTRHRPATRAGRATMYVGTVAIGGGIAALGFISARMLNRSTSFQDRRRIWTYVWDVSTRREWFGYGFGSFWRNEANVAPINTDTFRWDAAHNSFVEIYIGLGLVGLIAFAAFLAAATWSVRVEVRTAPNLVSLFPAMILAFVLVENMSESMILYHSTFWMLLIAVAFFSGASRSREPSELVHESVHA